MEAHHRHSHHLPCSTKPPMDWRERKLETGWIQLPREINLRILWIITWGGGGGEPGQTIFFYFTFQRINLRFPFRLSFNDVQVI